MRFMFALLALALSACTISPAQERLYGAYVAAAADIEAERASAHGAALEACRGNSDCIRDIVLASALAQAIGNRNGLVAPPDPNQYTAQVLTSAIPVLATGIVSYAQIKTTRDIAQINADRDEVLFGSFAGIAESGFDAIGTLGAEAAGAAGTHVTITAEGAPIGMFGSSVGTDGAVVIGRDSGAVGQDGALAQNSGGDSTAATDDAQTIGGNGMNAEDEGRNASHDLNFPAGECASGASSATTGAGGNSGNTNCGTVVGAGAVVLPPPPDFSPPPPGGG
jgi:hypothetical protein